ncbi:MAG: DUF6798 domain-containing protein [Xenococcaceae cyanobacterium]
MNTIRTDRAKNPFPIIYIFIISIVLIFYGYIFPSSNNLIEAPPVLAMLDPELYQNDFFVRDMLNITPRYYYQYLIYFPAKLGIDLAWIYFFYYVLAFSSLIIGLFKIGRRFGGSSLSSALLTFLALFTTDTTIGYVSIFRSEPIPAIFAMGLTIWGIYFCFCRNWNFGYLFFGLACVIQFLIGILPGLLFLPLLIIDAKKNNRFATSIASLLILGCFAALVYLPMIFTGNTDNKIISNTDFVYFYGYIRHPHHIIISSFRFKNWRNFLLFISGGILIIKSTKWLDREDKNSLLIIIAASFLALGFGYIFVELYPSSSFAKLQLARTTPFAVLMVLIAVSVIINEHYRLRNIAICLLLLITPIVNNGTILFFAIAFSLLFLKEQSSLTFTRSKLAISITILLVLVLIAFNPPTFSLVEIVARLLNKLIPLAILTLPFIIEEFLGNSRQLKIAIYTLSFVSYSFLSLSLFNLLPKNISNFVLNKITVNKINDDNITKIALEFRQLTHKDATILIPPSLTQFRWYSQRAVVFDFRSFPYTDRGIQEWAKRLKMFSGGDSYLNSPQDLDSVYSQFSDRDLLNLAKEFNAQYILTRSDWHTNFPAEAIAKEGKWTIYQLKNREKKI